MTNTRMITSHFFRPVVMYVDTDQDICTSWGSSYTCSDIEVKDENNWVIYKCMYCNHKDYMQKSCLALTSVGKRCRRSSGKFGYCSHHDGETAEVYAASVETHLPWKVESIEEYASQAKTVAMLIAKRDIFRRIKMLKDLSLGVLYERVERIQQDCYIYFLKCGNYVKIGSSFTPETRIAQLKKENDVTLRPKSIKMEDAVCIGWVQGARSLERDIHQALSKYRENGEWFQWSPKVEALVHDVIADELNVKDAILRAIDDPDILDRLDDSDFRKEADFLEIEIDKVNEELEDLLKTDNW